MVVEGSGERGQEPLSAISSLQVEKRDERKTER